jgi:hypothetical protein
MNDIFDDQGSESAELIEQVSGNPWDNVYWFSRMLINSDKYGGAGSDNKTMGQIASLINLALDKTLVNETEQEAMNILKCSIEKTFTDRWQNTKKISAIKNLLKDISQKLITKKDYQIFALTCEKIMIPINIALESIPSNDLEFAHSLAFALLQSKGENGLASVINLWDDVGSFGCMTAERAQIVRCFSVIGQQLESMDLTEFEKDIVLTSFCQEFERRVGQKRKGRAGRGVEGVTSFILDYYKIKASEKPEHFTTGLEIDRWVKTKSGWYIGISCKRTLRERWKQAYTTDLDLLSEHKIKALWHVMTFDRDLSDDKLTEMGSHRAVFYLPDSSERYQSASKHVGMSNYVRPLTSFVQDLKKEINE